MAAVSQSRAAGLSGSTSLSRHRVGRSCRSSASNAARHYWSTARHTNASHHRHQPGVYSYMRPYPQRGVPRYGDRVNHLNHKYMRGVYQNHEQIRRNYSNRRSEDKDERRSSQTKDGRQDSIPKKERRDPKDPWETRTRMAGERYLRMMEERMRLLRKDPYDILFGGSEARGVWNPWRRYYELHQKMMDDAFGQHAESSSKASPGNTEPKAQEAGKQPRSASADTTPDAPTPTKTVAEWRFDPISCKKVPFEDYSKPATDNSVGQSISVKTYKSKDSAVKRTVPHVKGPQGVERGEAKAQLSGFARQPWLVKEGFVQSSTASDQQTGSAPKNESNKSNRVTALHPPQKSAGIFMTGRMESSKAATQPKAAASNAPMSTTNDLLREGAFWYDDRPDRREDLDLLRASDVRAASGKVRKPLEPVLSREERWAKVEGAASNLFKDREDRLYREFAADKWELKRSWSAYPGEIARSAEERRARRRLLERSFNSSMNLFEYEISKALGLATSPFYQASRNTSSRNEGLGIHSTSSMRNVASYIQTLREQIRAKQSEAAKAQQRERNREADVMLQKEIDLQKAAMMAHENRPRIAKSYKAPRSSVVETPKAALLNEQVKALRESREAVKRSKAKEDELVREIRSIYEESYGTINTQHRQGAPKGTGRLKPEARMSIGGDVKSEALKASPASALQTTSLGVKDKAGVEDPRATSDKALPASNGQGRSSASTKHIVTSSSKTIEGPSRDTPISLPEERPNHNFILLSFDKPKQKVRVIRTSSSKYEERSARRSTVAIMDRLANPGQYFDHIETLEASGYELVAGSKDLLVYKDTLNRSLSSQMDVTALLETTSGANQGTVEATTVSMASKTSRLPEKISVRQQEPASTSNDTSQPVRRMEERFSGPGARFTDAHPEQQQQLEAPAESRRSTFKQVFWRTMAIVGVIYGFGVFMEWAKERDREQLTKEYQREVQRVRELERRRAEEKNATSRWGF